MLPEDEGAVLRSILNHVDVRSRPVQSRLRYVLAVLGQKQQCGRLVTWETAGAYLYELCLVPDFGLNSGIVNSQIAQNSRSIGILLDGEKSLEQNLLRLIVEGGLSDEGIRRQLSIYLADKDLLRPYQWLPPICHDEKVRKELSFEEWKFTQPLTGVRVDLKPFRDPKKAGKVAPGLSDDNGALTSDGKKPIGIAWTVSPLRYDGLGNFLVTVIRQTQDQGEIDVIPPQYVSGKRRRFRVPIEQNNLDEGEKIVARIRVQALGKTGTPIADGQDESEEFWIDNKGEIEIPPPERGQRIRHLDELTFQTVRETGSTSTVRNRGWDLRRDYVYNVRLANNRRGDLWLNPTLRDLEGVVLENPQTLGIYEADLRDKRTARVEDFEPVGLPSTVSQLASEFYEARADFFAVVRDLDNGRGVVRSRISMLSTIRPQHTSRNTGVS